MYVKAAAAVALVLAVPLLGCEVQEEGELPDVEVENGELPEVDADPDNVDVEVEEDTLVVPTPEVETGPDTAGATDTTGSAPRY